MTGISLTLGQHWIDHYLSGLILVHTLTGRPVSIRPKAAPTLDTLVQLLKDIATGVYDSGKYVSAGQQASPPSLVLQSPTLAPKARYAAVSLNASTARSQFISVATGGIIFEDPFWAILAANAVSHKPPLALPIAKDNDALWKNTSVAAAAAKQGTYDPQRFFGKIEGFVPPNAPPKFELIVVDSAQLTALRSRGMQALKVAVPPKFFELFQ